MNDMMVEGSVCVLCVPLPLYVPFCTADLLFEIKNTTFVRKLENSPK